MVFLKWKVTLLVSHSAEQSRMTWRDVIGSMVRREKTHVGLLVVDTRNALLQPILLLVIIRNESIRLDIAADDFKASFVADAVIPGNRRGWVVTGHTMYWKS